MTGFESYPCPYCGVMVQAGDKHAVSIERKTLKDAPSIVVTCTLVRTFKVSLEEVKPQCSTR